MQMTHHKTRSVFERYNIVSGCDLVEAAKTLNTIPEARLKSGTTFDPEFRFRSSSAQFGHTRYSEFALRRSL